MPDVIRPASPGIAAWETTKRLIRVLNQRGGLSREATAALLDDVVRSLTEAGGIDRKGAAEVVRQYQAELREKQ
jgi:hypothetical protein